MEEYYSSKRIKTAIIRLSYSVQNSELQPNEKKMLMQALKKIAVYYVDGIKEIDKHREKMGYRFALERLDSALVDYMVAINDTIKGKNDVIKVVNMIYKEINYDRTTGKFKRKRLI